MLFSALILIKIAVYIRTVRIVLKGFIFYFLIFTCLEKAHVSAFEAVLHAGTVIWNTSPLALACKELQYSIWSNLSLPNQVKAPMSSLAPSMAIRFRNVRHRQ